MKLTFPAISTSGRPSRQFLSEVRTTLQNWANWAYKSPRQTTALLAQLRAFMTPVYPTAAVVVTGQALTVPVTGTYTNTATVTVANGAVTAIVLS